MEFEAVIGLEVHAELETNTKMFCSCPVVDNTLAEPNTAVCPVCNGLPGVLPVVNKKAVEYAVKVALALNCEIRERSIFARKNYFYPDLPKGYQISQYEEPLAEDGYLDIETEAGQKRIRIRRAHLEEDTGKLTHVSENDSEYSLVDLNRAGVALLEIVTEPDMRTVEEVRAYATGLHAIIKALKVNSANMSKGVIRFEANVSLRPKGSDELNTRVEIKNLNSFRTMEKAILYEIERQSEIYRNGGTIRQETLGWDEETQQTFSQRGKEEAHDYRYFPEPDLPPLIVSSEWVEEIRKTLPELPQHKINRYMQDFGLTRKDAAVLARDEFTASFFETCIQKAPDLKPEEIAKWILVQLFSWINDNDVLFEEIKIGPDDLIALIETLKAGVININTARDVLIEMLNTGKSADQIIQSNGLQQISDSSMIEDMIKSVLQDNANEREAYLNGKETLENWFFGQVMRNAKGKANPNIIREILKEQLMILKKTHNNNG